MRVLGIDPGFDRLGLAVLEGDPSRPTYVWSTCVTPAKGPMEERLAVVKDAVSSALREYTPDRASLETLFFSTNKKTAMAVAQARGAVLSVLGEAGIPVTEYSPGTVKVAVTGNGRADKTAMARMIPHLIPLPSKKRGDDELDALAVALCGLTSR